MWFNGAGRSVATVGIQFLRSRIEDLVEGGVEEAGCGGLGGGEPGFQRVAPAHQLVHLCYDPLLFGQRGKWKTHFCERLPSKMWNARTSEITFQRAGICKNFHAKGKEMAIEFVAGTNSV